MLATREGILTEHQSADAGRTAALGSLDVARRTFADARYSLRNATAMRLVTSFLDQKIGDANETALSTVALAENANTEAQTAANAMNDAATSIKAAASAVETVIVDVNGIAGVTNTNDKTDPINSAAQDAVVAVANLATAVDELKVLALLANIQAASPQTAPVVQATIANQTSLSNLLSTFDSALKVASSAVTDASTARTNDLNELFGRSETFTAAASDDAALGRAIKLMDAVSNDALEAVPFNTATPISQPNGQAEDRKAGKGGKEKAGSRASNLGGDQQYAGFKVSWTLSPDVAKETVEMTLFAVPSSQAPSFDYLAALKAKDQKNCVVYDGKPSDLSPPVFPNASVVVQKDTNGDAIVFGQTYRMFALRTPDKDHGPQTATHFSFPTPPVQSTVLLKFPFAPYVYRFGDDAAPLIPHNAFLVVIPAAIPTSSVQTHRIFFAPAEVAETTQDELLIADALNAAGYTELTPSEPLSKLPSDLSLKIWKQLASEVPGGEKHLRTLAEPLKAWLHTTTSALESFYVIYFSPLATISRGDGNFYVGRYADMYGDLLDLDERAYCAYAFALGASKDAETQAENVLSDRSAKFPPNIPVPPMPATAS